MWCIPASGSRQSGALRGARERGYWFAPVFDEITDMIRDADIAFINLGDADGRRRAPGQLLATRVSSGPQDIGRGSCRTSGFVLSTLQTITGRQRRGRAAFGTMRLLRIAAGGNDRRLSKL